MQSFLNLVVGAIIIFSVQNTFAAISCENRLEKKRHEMDIIAKSIVRVEKAKADLEIEMQKMLALQSDYDQILKNCK